MTREQKRVPIFHIASMARSGETMLLHILARHSSVRVVHNMRKHDRLHEKLLFHYLMNYRDQHIPRYHPFLLPCFVKNNDIMIIKQGVWEHAYPFQGIVFARNPLSIFASLKYYGISQDEDWKWHWYRFRVPRFIAWLKKMDRSLIKGFADKSPLEQFCIFYTRRMKALAALDQPIIHYEYLVAQPEKYIQMICGFFGIQYEAGMLNPSKLGYENGHGHYDSHREIDQSSIRKYQERLQENEMDFVIENTHATAKLYGYEFNKYELSISPKVNEIIN